MRSKMIGVIHIQGRIIKASCSTVCLFLVVDCENRCASLIADIIMGYATTSDLICLTLSSYIEVINSICPVNRNVH